MDMAMLEMFGAYTVWANDRLLESLAELPDWELHQSHTKGQLFYHITKLLSDEAELTAAYAGSALPLDWSAFKTIADLAPIPAQIGTMRARFLQTCDPGMLARETEVELGSSSLTAPLWQFVLESLISSAQRRGEIVAYLNVAAHWIDSEHFMFYALLHRSEEWPWKPVPGEAR